MSHGMEVLRRVLVLRLIAAADVPAGEAESEMNPGVAHLQAFLTSVRRAWRDGFEIFEVCALCWHKSVINVIREEP